MRLSQRFLRRRNFFSCFFFRKKIFHHVKFTRRTAILLLLFVITSVLCCVILERRSGPQVHALASTVAKQQATAAVSAAVEKVLIEEDMRYDSFVEYTAVQGELRSIQTNARAVNLLRGKINAAVEEAVTLRHGRLKLPMGALLGSHLFAGIGPNLVVPLTMTGHALSDVRSDLTSAGLNQTMHRVLMDLNVGISVILPGGVETSEITLTVCLAETVIVGEVPFR